MRLFLIIPLLYTLSNTKHFIEIIEEGGFINVS